jgi:hypothetical protein
MAVEVSRSCCCLCACESDLFVFEAGAESLGPFGCQRFAKKVGDGVLLLLVLRQWMFCCCSRACSRRSRMRRLGGDSSAWPLSDRFVLLRVLCVLCFDSVS